MADNCSVCCSRMTCLPVAGTSFDPENVVKPLNSYSGLSETEFLQTSPRRAPDPELSPAGLGASLLLMLTGTFYVAYTRIGMPESCNASLETYFLWQGVATLACGFGMACVYLAGKNLLYLSMRAQEGAPTPGKFSIAGSFFGGLVLLVLLQVASLAFLVRGILLFSDAQASAECGTAKTVFWTLLALSVVVQCGTVCVCWGILRVLSPRHFG